MATCNLRYDDEYSNSVCGHVPCEVIAETTTACTCPPQRTYSRSAPGITRGAARNAVPRTLAKRARRRLGTVGGARRRRVAREVGRGREVRDVREGRLTLEQYRATLSAAAAEEERTPP